MFFYLKLKFIVYSDIAPNCSLHFQVAISGLNPQIYKWNCSLQKFCIPPKNYDICLSIVCTRQNNMFKNLTTYLNVIQFYLCQQMKAKIEGEFLLEGFCSKASPHFQLLHSYFQASQTPLKNTNLFKPKRTLYLTEKKYKGRIKGS